MKNTKKQNYWFNQFVNLTLFVEDGEDFTPEEKINIIISKEIASGKEVLSFNYGLDIRTAIYIDMIKNHIKTDIDEIRYIGAYRLKNFGEDLYFIGGFVIKEYDGRCYSNKFADIEFIGYMISNNQFETYKDGIEHILECIMY